MEIIKGTYAEAKVFADDMEQYARAQLQMICDDPVAEGSRIRVMPDVHPGKVGTIGLTMTVGEKLIPHLLGIDIGCGMTCTVLKDKRLEPQKLDRVIRENIPSGFHNRKTPHHLSDGFDPAGLRCGRHIHKDRAMLALGTLGGGNHFIEVDQDGEGTLYVVVHSGSRHLGKEVTDYYVDAGAEALKQKGIERPYPMTWLEGELLEDYIADVQAVQAYAQLNREIMLAEILKGMKMKGTDRFSSVHNYIDTESGERILRKGAIRAKAGERVIIPANMRDGVILGIGKGNPDWNESAPHGSGRILRRDEVKNTYTVSAFRNEMKGVYCSCIAADTLDEAPFAYRPMEKLFAAWQKEFPDIEEVSRRQGRRKDCFHSVLFTMEQDLSALEGTVLWICKSPVRPGHKRKNWYVDVSIIPEKDEIPSEEEYRIEKFHSGGKGGQNVNKVETGVRVIHIPTGITVTSTEERSQYMNKQKALKRLQGILAAMEQEAGARQTNQAWREHTRIVRGNPVRVYEGMEFRRKE